MVLNKDALDDMGSMYKFVSSPALRVERSFDSKGSGGYGFHVVDLELTNWRLYYDSLDHTGV